MITDPGPRAAVAELLGYDLVGALEQGFRQVDIAEDEIERASKDHPEAADLLYHGFKLLGATHQLMVTGHPQLYRAHCTELLERLASGQDTRPGTDAEVCCACSDMSALAPFNETGAGVYATAFSRVFPDEHHWDDQLPHYQALHGPGIADMTADMRRKLTRPERRIPKDLTCKGLHHGDEIDCRFRDGGLFEAPQTPAAAAANPARPRAAITATPKENEHDDALTLF